MLVKKYSLQTLTTIYIVGKECLVTILAFLGGRKGKKGIRHSSRGGHIYPLSSPVKPGELSLSCLCTAAAAFASTRFIFYLSYLITKTKMDRERLMKMAGAVRTGGKGSMRRKKKAIHRATTTDDKRLQSTLKRIGVNTIPAIEEVNIFKDDAVIQFLNPKVFFPAQMDRERLMKMAGAVRTGGKGSMRRKKKAIHRATTTDDKRLQSTLKRIGVNTIPAIEEVNIFKDDAVIQFLNPKVQASIAANTWVVSGSPQTKKLQDILPGIINQLGPDNLDNLRKLAEQFQKQQPPTGAQATQEEDDDEVPELVAGETFETAAEDGHTHTS
nr:basic transcription factor 3 [Quercus suber]